MLREGTESPTSDETKRETAKGHLQKVADLGTHQRTGMFFHIFLKGYYRLDRSRPVAVH